MRSSLSAPESVKYLSKLSVYNWSVFHLLWVFWTLTLKVHMTARPRQWPTTPGVKLHTPAESLTTLISAAFTQLGDEKVIGVEGAGFFLKTLLYLYNPQNWSMDSKDSIFLDVWVRSGLVWSKYICQMILECANVQSKRFYCPICTYSVMNIGNVEINASPR